jgi:hypothetical protein
MDALNNHDVNGILVDTYAAGSRTDLFNDPSLRVAKVLDYKMAYGLVTAGHAIKLRRCFQDYLNVYKVDIFYSIVNNVRQVEVLLNLCVPTVLSQYTVNNCLYI